MTNAKLCIGLCTVHRPVSYLRTTLHSLFSNMTQPEDIVVRLYQCDDHELDLVDFSEEIKTGRLETLKVIDRPDLTNLEQNFGDDDTRIKWRTKQCFDYSEAFRLSAGVAPYYMHIEDDVVACKNFDKLAIQTIDTLRDKKWSMIRMASGFIGLVFHDKDLLKVSGLLRNFCDEMPCDWLIDHFCAIKSKSGAVARKTPYSIFQHIGVERTLPGHGPQLVKFNNFVG